MAKKGLLDFSIKQYASKSGAVRSTVFYSIWCAVAIACFVGGLVLFLGYEGIDRLIGWIVWGAICTIPILGTVLRMAKKEGARGAQDGANTYTVESDPYGNVTVSNHPLRDAIIGFLAGILAGIIMGPIVVCVYLILNVVRICSAIKQIIQFSKAEKSAKQ